MAKSASCIRERDAEIFWETFSRLAMVALKRFCSAPRFALTSEIKDKAPSMIFRALFEPICVETSTVETDYRVEASGVAAATMVVSEPPTVKPFAE